MNLEQEYNTSLTLYGSGERLVINNGQIAIDLPPDDPALQAPPLTIRRGPQPDGEPGVATMGDGDVPAASRAPKAPIDWTDPMQAQAAGTATMQARDPGWRENLVGGTQNVLTALGIDQFQAREIGERIWGGGKLAQGLGFVDAAALGTYPFSMGAAPFAGAAGLAVAAPSLVLGTEEGLQDVVEGIEGIKAGREGAVQDTAFAIGATILNALGIVATGRRPLRQGMELMRDNPRAAAAVGGTAAAGAVLSPDEAEGGVIDKVARFGKGTVTKLGKAEGETATAFVERMAREAPILTDAKSFVQIYGDPPAVSASMPSSAVALRATAPIDRNFAPVLPMGEIAGKPTGASPFAQIGGYFDSLVRMNNGGAPRVWSDATHQAQILNEAANEVRYQLSLAKPGSRNMTKITGFGWYDEDIEKTYNLAGQTMPELRTGAKRGVKVPWDGGTDNVTPRQARILAAAVGAPQSFGNPASRNADIKFQAYEVFRQTGQFPEKGIFLSDSGAIESTGKYWTQRAVSEQYIGVLNTLIREIGPAKAADWLVSEHSIRELRDLKRRATNADGEAIFKGEGTMGISGEADEKRIGAFVFGPKGGQFMGNLLGFPGTTTDMWFTRTWNRYLGTSREGIGALSETGLVEQPRNLAERNEMADFSRRLTTMLNQDQALVTSLGRPLTERDTQAVLWYFEQQMYRDLGVRVTPTSFGEGAEIYAKRAKEQGGTGIARR